MSTQLNGYTLPDNIIDKMKRLKMLSNNTNEESCFSLCVDNSGTGTKYKNNIIVDRNPHKGKMCPSIISPKCYPGETPVGIFRTYKKEEGIGIKKQDMIAAYRHGIMCVPSKNETMCVSRKGNYDKKINNKLLSMIKDEEEDLKVRLMSNDVARYYSILESYISSDFVKLNVYKRND